MATTKLSDAKDMIKCAREAGTSVMLWGAPGIGKSSIVREIAEENDEPLIDFRLAQIEPTDLRGIPIPMEETGRTKWFLPDILPIEGKGSPTGILFLDEIEKAPISVKNAALQLVYDRKIGDYELPKGWFVVGAGNREDDGCFSATLGSALNNRMAHIEIEPDLDAWLEWAETKNIHESIKGFLKFRPGFLYDYSGKFNAFPTPRTWEMVNELLKTTETKDLQNKLVQSVIGQHHAKEFRTYNEVYSKVNVEEIFNGIYPSELTNSDKPHIRFATTTAVAVALKRRKSITGIESGLAGFLKLLPPDCRVVFSKDITDKILDEIAYCEDFRPVVKDLMFFSTSETSER